MGDEYRGGLAKMRVLGVCGVCRAEAGRPVPSRSSDDRRGVFGAVKALARTLRIETCAFLVYKTLLYIIGCCPNKKNEYKRCRRDG